MRSLTQYIINEQMICEHIVTLFNNQPEDAELLRQMAPMLHKWIDDAYRYLKGVPDAKTVEDFIKNYIDVDEDMMFKVIRKGGNPVAFNVYKMRGNGRKTICGASDGTEIGKDALSLIFKEDFKMEERHTYSEVSGKMVSFVLKNGATPVPADIVSRIINKQVTPLEDGFFYSRNLHGEQHRKMLVGMPKGYKPIPIDSELIAKLKDLAKQYS